ncbi:MAG: arsenate reductase ArsC [Pseudomonadota bacterium]
MNHKIRVLFLCTGNSCRSQMAEGWARHLLGDIVEAYSAGIEAHGLNPRAVRVMAEAGVDISAQRSKTIGDLGGIEFDVVVTVCDRAHKSCPIFPGKVLKTELPRLPRRRSYFAAGCSETLQFHEFCLIASILQLSVIISK